MIVFVDTNIIAEYLEGRSQSCFIDQFLNYCEREGVLKHLSIGSFYTLTYLTERHLRKKGFSAPAITEKLRSILTDISKSFIIDGLTQNLLEEAILNQCFIDLEDSYQYSVAQSIGADILLTINKKDFIGISNPDIKILSPEEFVNSFIK